MNVTILHEAGYIPALFGLGLSHGLTSDTTPAELDVAMLDRLHHIAFKLCDSDGGHNKFLESIQVWLDVDAPRFWWSEFDTYRVGVTKQSESTMHTLGKRPVTNADLEHPLTLARLLELNDLFMSDAPIDVKKNEVPDGLLQRRIVNMNYKSIRGVILQRHSHRLPQWHIFIDALKRLEHSELLPLEEK